MDITHFLLLLLPGRVEQSLALPLLLLFHVVVHRVVVSILVHGCWHNPPTADRQQGHDDRPTERDRDRDGRAETVGYSDSPTPLLRAVAAAAAAAAAAAHGAHQIPPAPTAFCCQDAGGPRSFRAASPSPARPAVICVLAATKELAGRREGPGTAVHAAGDRAACCCCCCCCC